MASVPAHGAGAVLARPRYRHPIEIARRVMETTPHVMLAGAGAELFAERHGFKQAELLTPEAEAIWRERILSGAPTGSNLYADSYQMYMDAVRDWVKLLHDRLLGTTNVLVRDAAGDIASAVSTSGWGFKWPGRIGDSAIIGAGNYADNRYGAAACTGCGEMAIRGATAYSIVRCMRDGVALDDALRRAMLDLRDLIDPFAERVNVMNAVAIDRDGTSEPSQPLPIPLTCSRRSTCPTRRAPARLRLTHGLYLLAAESRLARVGSAKTNSSVLENGALIGMHPVK